MERKTRSLVIKTFGVILIIAFAAIQGAKVMSKPQEPGPFPPPKKEPPVVTPGKTNSDPPSDAVVLFDGKDLSRWRSVKGGGEPK